MNPLDPNNYNVDPAYIDARLENIRKGYLFRKSLVGYGKEQREEDLKAAKSYAEKLYKILPILGVEQFDHDTANSRSDLEFTLPFFISSCEQAIPNQLANPPRKTPEVTLLRNNLFRLFKRVYIGKESLGYKSKKARKYVGAYPDFLEYVLPYFSIDAVKVQAYCKPLDTPLKKIPE